MDIPGEERTALMFTFGKDEIQKALTVSSEQLLFSSIEERNDWVQRLKQTEEIQPLLNEIYEEKDRLLAEVFQDVSYSLFRLYHETGNRREFESVYFEKRRRLNTFALMVLLEPENEVYQKELQEIIWSICNEYSWCLPAHLPEVQGITKHSIKQPLGRERVIDLFSAETAFALAEIYHLTKDHLEPTIQKRIYDEIYGRVLWPYMEHSYFWEKAPHNWSAVCAGSIGCAAIYLIEDEAELAYILSRVLSSMNHFMSGFADDGACLEGYSYWEYGFGFFVYFADLLKKKTAGAIDLFTHPKVQAVSLFQEKIFLYEHLLANFSDSNPTRNIFLGLSHYLHQTYPEMTIPQDSMRAAYTDDFCSRWASAFRNLYWYNPSYEGKPWPKGTYYFPNAEWIVSRYNHYAFAAKGGYNDEPHNHNDVGHFILTAKDEVYLKDLGAGEYTKAYFSHKRYDYICNSAKGHSVPIIDDVIQLPGKHYRATNVQSSLSGATDTFEMNMEKAYSHPHLQSLHRRFSWNKSPSPSLVLQDSFQFDQEPKTVKERFILGAMPVEQVDGGWMLQGKEKLFIQYDTDALEGKVREEHFINHSGEKEAFQILDVSVKEPKKQMTITVTFQFLPN